MRAIEPADEVGNDRLDAPAFIAGQAHGFPQPLEPRLERRLRGSPHAPADRRCKNQGNDSAANPLRGQSEQNNSRRDRHRSGDPDEAEIQR